MCCNDIAYFPKLLIVLLTMSKLNHGVALANYMYRTIIQLEHWYPVQTALSCTVNENDIDCSYTPKQ